MIVYACLPARYNSARFPGKVLAKDTGKFLIQHTYERACLAKLPNKILIAADDKRIAQAAKSFGAECIMTSRYCASGTDRIAEAVAGLDVDIVINLQADEPEIDPANIDAVAKLLLENQKTCPEPAEGSKIKNKKYDMATLAAEFQNAQQIADPNIVKVVVASIEHRALSAEALAKAESSIGARRAVYFSRSPIPYDREKGGVGPINCYLRHLGIYAYRKDFLLKFTKLPQGQLEQIEKLEQLRAIENGFEIIVGKVKHFCDGIDTPQQYAEFVKRYKNGHRGHRE